MNKQIVTAAIVQSGYQDAPTIKFFGEEDGCAEFLAAEPYYDPKADKNTSWNNWHIKAFHRMCEKIKKMRLKEGSRITFCGSIKTERWQSKDGHSRQRFYVLLEDIEYASAGSRKADDTASESETTSETEHKEAEIDIDSSEEYRFGAFEVLGDDDLPF